MRRLLYLLLFFCLSVGMAAASVTGTIYENVPNAGDATASANQSSSLPNATFTSPDINYCASTGGAPSVKCTTTGPYTVAGFLSNATFGAGANGFDPNATANNIEIVISGSTFLNAGSNTFSVGHDDGAVINFPALSLTIGNGGPTAPTVSDFTVTAPSAGMYSFTLEYAECCGSPAELIWQINDAPVGPPSSVPEPNSLVLLGTGIAGVAGLLRRKLLG